MRVYTGDNGMGLALRPPTGLPQARTRIYRGANRSRGVGQATAPGGMGQAIFAQPGPGAVGTQIVDANGNIVYSAAQVAANPSLLNQLNNGACTPPMVPTYFPGGQSECSMPGTVTSQIYGAPIDVCDDPSGLCQDSTFNGQTISQPNQLPSTALPSGYLSNGMPAAGSQGVTASLPNNPLAPAPSQALTPPATGTVVNPAAPGSGIAPGTVVNGTPTGGAATVTCNGIGVGPCIGPLDAGTWGLIAAGALVLWMAMGTKK